MCTLTWKRTEQGMVLFFNRDEQRSRLPGLPPTLQQRNGMCFLAPTDPHHHGTWILVNDHGLILCILNHYPGVVLPYRPNAPSRGLLPLLCADCHDAAEAMDRLLAIPSGAYMPFRFIAFSPGQDTQAVWDGKQVSATLLPPQGGMLTSSAFCPDAVEQFRQMVFRTKVGPVETASIEELSDFHHYSASDKAYGIRMSRPDACTHSLTRISVSNRTNQAVMAYESLLHAAPGGNRTEMALPLKPMGGRHDTRSIPVQEAH